MAFTTIFIQPGLSDRRYRKARLAGPPAVSSRRREQVELLEAAAFTEIEEIDVTGEFLETSRAWLRAREEHAEVFREVEGPEFGDRLKKSRTDVAAIEDGLLGRALFAAIRA